MTRSIISFKNVNGNIFKQKQTAKATQLPTTEKAAKSPRQIQSTTDSQHTPLVISKWRVDGEFKGYTKDINVRYTKSQHPHQPTFTNKSVSKLSKKQHPRNNPSEGETNAYIYPTNENKKYLFQSWEWMMDSQSDTGAESEVYFCIRASSTEVNRRRQHRKSTFSNAAPHTNFSKKKKAAFPKATFSINWFPSNVPQHWSAYLQVNLNIGDV